VGGYEEDAVEPPAFLEPLDAGETEYGTEDEGDGSSPNGWLPGG
jgi:hypothetical protein